ncbi:DUF4062 domain-containing protein [Candidatus Uabimicrobium amorphum]|uniref:NACHT domain-containing protein n=1 Tax=Uabimicrobium amorphum TaxID=2596890 RepID=A0A5S9F2D9_UABAM|nr:DUF4062 domain-containing protein [Candidatus Uabimicrobium amorphum]BBM83013.1 hypothetical protein UABAM_01356 [Candidatus Uabimicrobium amorphum]
MKTNWKILKVFLSSTFKDLELTRDRLANIFETIERTILKRSLTIRPYDLRWRDRHSDEPIVEWCIRMVRQCDYFIGILGNRYGWRPPYRADGKENTINISMTEMEIKEALATIPRENRFFCFTSFQDIEDENEEDIKAMEKLKEFLRSKKETIFECDSLEQLMQCIEQKFTETVDAQFPPDVIVTAEQLSRLEALDEFIEEKLKGFVGRQKDIEDLCNFAVGEERANYLVVNAVAGTGKSALMGKFMRHIDEQKNMVRIAHFLSIDGGAREVKEILLSLVDQLHSNQIITEEPESEIKSLRNQLQEALENYDKQLLLIIDGIDEVEEDGRSLFWLPRNLPQNIRVVVTTRPVDTLEVLNTYPFVQTKHLEVLHERDIAQIIDNYMKEHQLQYNEQDREILQKNCAGNPLYLKVGLDELRASGTSVAQLAMTVDALFHQILNRLEEKYQQKFDKTGVGVSAKEFFEKYLGFIAAGRTGVLEKELQDILKIGDDLLLPISKSLSNFIITRSGFLNFFHPEFERTIKARIGKQKMRGMHEELATYFSHKGLDYVRSLDELPYQLQWSEQYSELLKLLTSIVFLEGKGQRNLIQGLREDFRLALDNQVVAVPENCRVEISPDICVDRNTIRLMYKALEIDFHLLQQQPQSIFHCLWNRCYWHDCPELAQRYQLEISSVEKMYKLAEKWRREITPRKLWLRSLRPLPQRMDSAIMSTLRGHSKPIQQIHIHKHKAASAGQDHSVKIWDLKTEICLFTLKHRHQVNSVNWHPQGNYLASAAEDGCVKIWNAQTGEEIHNWDHTGSVSSVKWSHDGSYIASGSRDGQVRVWSLDKKEIIATLEGHKGGVFCVDWHPDDDLIASASKDRNINIWKWQEQQCVAVLRGHSERIFSVSWSHDGLYLASGAHDNEVRIWDFTKEKCTATFRNHTNVVNDVQWHPQKNVLASASQDKTIRIWDIESGEQLSCLEGADGKIGCVAWTANNDLISGGDDHLIRLWNPKVAQFTIPFEEQHTKIRTIAWHPKGTHVASVLENGHVQIWDVEKAKIFCTLRTAPQTFDAVWIDDEQLATLDTDITVWLWEKQRREEQLEFQSNKQLFQKWKSCTVVSGTHAVQEEPQSTLVMCDEGKMSYFPAPLSHAVCLESGYLSGHSQAYLYLFEIMKESFASE